MAVRIIGKKADCLVGIVVVIVASIFYAANTILFQDAYNTNTNIKIPASQMVFLQSVTQLVIITVLLVYHKIPVHGENWKNFLMLLVVGCCKLLSLVLMQKSLDYMRFGGFMILSSLYIFVAVVLNRIVMQKEDNPLTFDVLAIVGILGIAAIAEPDLTNHRYHTLTNLVRNYEQLKGILIVASAVICESIFLVLSRKVILDIDYRLAIFYPSLLGTVLLPLFMVATKTEIIIGDIDDNTLFNILFGALSGSIAIYLTVFSLTKLTVPPVAVLLSAHVLWEYAFEVIVGKTFMAIIPSMGVLVLIITCLLAVLIEIYGWHVPSLMDCN